MSKSYFKTCDYCKEKIEMSDREGKWLPYNLNNGPHDCSMRHKKEITLEMIQTKLESIGIIINLNRLMNQ